jgi:hypothetical protein
MIEIELAIFRQFVARRLIPKVDAGEAEPAAPRLGTLDASNGRSAIRTTEMPSRYQT